MSVREARLSRRDVLKFSAFGAAALALPLESVVRAKTASQIAASKLPKPYTMPFAVPPAYDMRGGGTRTIVQRPASLPIIPGFTTTIFGYDGITPGPTIHVQRGTPISLRIENRLNELPSGATKPTWNNYEAWTSVHLHGSASKPQFDGYASDITNPGQAKTYQYPNKQDARTLWYHDHGVHHTAENAYMGLAAQYHMHDDVEAGLTIPKWDFSKTDTKDQYDLPLTLADKMFASNGQFSYDDEGHSGLYGDVILVNGVPWPNLQVKRRKYRFRVLNACISRGFRLQLSNGQPITVIGTDGGLMPKPQTTAQLRVGMAERYEIVLDFDKIFKGLKAGTKVQLVNLGVPNSRDYDNTGKVMQFEVVDDAFDPADNDFADKNGNLNPNQEVMGLTENDAKDATGKVKTVKIDVVRTNGLWKIQSVDDKGKTLNMTWDDIVNSKYKEVVANPKLGEVQVWEMTNKSGGWFHPVHVHLVDFKILSRNGKAPFNYELGPKDVAYVGENETVRTVMRFGDKEGKDTEVTGRYMIHCHNLPHEDHDMMTQFRVGDDTADNDPMESAKAQKL